MPAIFNPSLTISLSGKYDVVAVVAGEVFLSPIEQCMLRNCPESFNSEFTIQASVSGVDWGNSLNHLHSWDPEPLTFEEGQNRKPVRFEGRFRRGGTLNEDNLPGQADEIVGFLRIESIFPGRGSVGLFTQIVTGHY